MNPIPAQHTWTVDSLRPKITFTEQAGNATGTDRWADRVTNDRSPTWSWTIEDVNPELAEDECYLYDDTSSYETLLSNAMLKCASHF